MTAMAYEDRLQAFAEGKRLGQLAKAVRDPGGGLAVRNVVGVLCLTQEFTHLREAEHARGFLGHRPRSTGGGGPSSGRGAGAAGASRASHRVW